MGVLPQQPRGDQLVGMYWVAGNMTETYYGEENQRKSNLEAPRVTINNHRMTNVQLPSGQVVQGIRRNNDLGYENQPPVAYESEQPLRPLRYTPGLKCDPALEALRPERSMKHQALQGGDTWRQKLIQTPQTYEGSFADADMQKFRPNPTPNAMEDPWFVSRLPDQPLGVGMGMAPPQMGGGGYPEDELTRIKMRNRRFQQSCAMDQGLYQAPMAPAQLRGQPWMGPQGPPPQFITEDISLAGLGDELSMIDQDLNMTRRATKPFVPQQDPGFQDLQRQVQLLESLPTAPVRPARVNVAEILGTDQLPAPAKRPAPKESPKEAPTAPAKPRQVGIADQIAIRSYVLGKGLGKTSSERSQLGTKTSPHSTA